MLTDRQGWSATSSEGDASCCIQYVQASNPEFPRKHEEKILIMIPAGQLMLGTKGHSGVLLNVFLIIAQSLTSRASLFAIAVCEICQPKKCIELEVIYDERDRPVLSGQWATLRQCETAFGTFLNFSLASTPEECTGRLILFLVRLITQQAGDPIAVYRGYLFCFNDR